jgi:tRNA1(Val) A37 N6-methylase TrmN6
MPQQPSAPATAPDIGEAAAPLDVTEDAFLGGQLMIGQPKNGPRAGLDAVFLAAACPAETGESVLEAGAGSGIVSLAVARRVPGTVVTGVEIDPRLAALARHNAEANGLAGKVRFVDGDVTWPSSRFEALGLVPSSFHHVLANPPFLTSGQARLPADAMLRRAHAAGPSEWEGWVRFLSAFARPKGTVTIIHRADALPRLLPLLERRFGRLVLFPLFPRIGEPASRIIIHGIKGSRASLIIREGLVLHRAEGGFTPAAEAILRGGARLELEAARTHFPG